MKNLWKRTLSLVLSGVLLLGSVPLAVFAEEETTAPVETTVVETQPIETEPAQIQPEETKPTVTETQPATEPAAQVITDDVANGGLGDQTPLVPKVRINDEEIEAGASLFEGTVSYSAEQDILILDKATSVTTISVEGKSLTIKLIGANKIQSDDEIAITAERDLTITGEGSLEIVTDNAIAVSVDGVAEGDSKKGLIIDGTQVSIQTDFEKTDEENPVGIVSENGVLIKGAAHFRTSHSRSEDPYVMDCNGYLNGADYTANTNCDGGSALEFIGGEHVGEWIDGDDEHYKTCAESTCALYQNTKVGNHQIVETPRYESISNTQHRKLYTCCDKVQNGFEEENHDLNYFIADSAIQVECADCKVTGSLTLTANDREVGSGVSEEDYTTEGILTGAEPDITYTNAENEEVTPEALGEYTVTMSYGGQTVTKKIKITKINLSNATVTVGGTYTYDGNAHEPENITVTRNDKTLVNGTDYTVSFSNNINAGAASVTVKAAENSDYMGEAAGTFTIQKKQLVTGDVKLGTALTYNGEEQSQTVVKTAEDSDVTFDVKDNKQTNAGENYQLTVEGTGNYAGEVKLPYSIAKSSAYTDATKKNQIVGTGMTGLQMPKFEGINETVDGKYTYQWNGTEIDSSVISSEVAKLKDGDTANLSYVFVPNSNSNYVAEERKGSITIKRVELVFEVEGEEGTMVPATEDNAVTILNEEKCIYGQDGIVTPKSIRVSYGGYSDSSPTYTVKYQRGTEAEQDSPSAGINDFIIYYSGTINNVDYQSVRVTTGKVSVAPKKPTPVAPNAKKLIFNDEDQELVEQGSPEMGVLKYSLYEEHSYETTVPKRRTAGAYYVWYKEVTPDNDNYADSDPQNVLVVIAPKLEAVYRQQLRDISSQLTGGFSWYTPEYPETNFVGEVGIQNVKLNYTPSDTVNYPTITNGYEVPITVAPKQINAIVTLEKTHYKYGLTSSGAPSKREPIPVVKYTEIEVVSADVNETEKKTLDSKEYTVTYENNENPGTATVKVTSNNYQFVNGTAAESGSTIEAEFTIYRPGVYKLSVVPTKLAETYTSLNKLEEALVKGLEDDHDKDDMVFYNVKMQEYVSAEKKWESTTDEQYFPKNDGYFTFAINYPTGTNKNTKFEAVAINTMNEGSCEVTPIKLEPKDEKLEFKMESYAAVCLAWNGYNDNSTFKVTTSAKNGTVKFNIGSDSTTKTESDAVKVKEKITVTATPKSGYALTEVKYTYNSGAFSVKVEQDSSGKYVFEMPAKDINITASFKKKTTNTKNPYSGDTSNIQLWVTVLAASGGTIGVLMTFWLKKRKK